MITPIEIRKQTFRKAFRGYEAEEVHAFLQTLSDEWEQQQYELRQLKSQFDQLQADYNSLKKVENMLHKTLLQAEQSAKQTLDNALQKAELKIQAAEAQGREIIRRSEDSASQLRRDIEKLESRKEEMVLHLEVFLKSQLDRLRAFERRELPASRLVQEEPEEAEPTRHEAPSQEASSPETTEPSVQEGRTSTAASNGKAPKNLFNSSAESETDALADDFADEL